VVYTMNNALSLSLDFQLRSACILYSIIKLKSSSVFSELFRLRPAARDTCDAVAGVDRLETPFTQLERDRCAFSLWGCALWNAIPCSIRGATNISDFRRMYGQYLTGWLTDGISLMSKFYEFV
jgi:hypothetical protein